MKSNNTYTICLTKVNNTVNIDAVSALLNDIFEVVKPRKTSISITTNDDIATVSFISTAKFKKNTTWSDVIMDSVVFKHRGSFTRMVMSRGDSSPIIVIFHYPFAGKGVCVTDNKQFRPIQAPNSQTPISPNVPNGQRPINPYY